MIDDDQFRFFDTDDARKLFDLAGAEQCRRFRLRHRNDAARPHVEIDGCRQPDRFFEPSLRRSVRNTGRPFPRAVSRLGARLRLEDRHEHDGTHATIVTSAAAVLPPLFARQLFRVRRAQLIRGTFRISDVGKLNRLPWHDGGNCVLVDELRVTVPP